MSANDARGPDGRFPAQSRGKTPAGSWPPFEPGNDAALTHGARSRNPDSPKGWGPLARQLATELVEVAPWAGQPAFAASVSAWARVEAQVQLLDRWLAEVGLLDNAGDARPAATMLAQFEKRAESLRSKLALDPASWARLLGSLSSAEGAGRELDDLRSVGARILESRDHAVIPDGDRDKSPAQQARSSEHVALAQKSGALEWPGEPT